MICTAMVGFVMIANKTKYWVKKGWLNMEIRIPANENFDFYACKKLYKKDKISSFIT